jgi:hypothetical protein
LSGKAVLSKSWKENMMKNIQQNPVENHKQATSESKQAPCWKNSEISTLIKAMTVYFCDLDTFGKKIDVEILLEKYRIYLESKYTVEQVIYAIHKHCEREGNVPKVGDINAILNPEKPKITQAEYIAAKEWQKRNNRYDEWTDAYDTIKAYEDQEKTERDNFLIQCEELKQVAGNAVKRIENA